MENKGKTIQDFAPYPSKVLLHPKMFKSVSMYNFHLDLLLDQEFLCKLLTLINLDLFSFCCTCLLHMLLNYTKMVVKMSKLQVVNKIEKIQLNVYLEEPILNFDFLEKMNVLEWWKE